MTEIITFEAQSKQGHGKGVSRETRRQGNIPAIIYGGPHKELMITLPLNELHKEYKKGNMQSKLTKITLNGQVITALVRDVQLDPVTDIPRHVDLQEVTENMIIRVAVQVKIINDDKCTALKRGGVLNITTRTIDLFCSPHAIPRNIEIDVSEFNLGQTLHINDITLPEGANPCDRSNFAVLSVSGTSDEDSAKTDSAG